MFRWVQYSGIIVIVLFSIYSTLSSFYIRESDPLVLNNDFIKTYAQFFEERFYDLRMALTAPKSQDKSARDHRLVLAGIDDESLSEIGRWPWPRSKISKLIDKLNNYGAKIVAFDVFFSEPEIVCRGDDSNDTLLANSIRNFQKDPNRKVILPYSVGPKFNVSSENSEEYYQELPDAMYFMSMDAKSTKDQWLLENVVQKKVFPIPELTETDAPLGHIEASADHDGVFRHYQLVANVDKIYVPSYALLTYQYYTNDRFVLEVPNIDQSFLKTEKGKVFLNQNGETKVRWHGAEEFFPYVSIRDILKAKDDDPDFHKVFKDKIVFVGSVAFGANDLRNTPVHQMLPGVYFHMNMVKMLLDGKFYQSPDKSLQMTIIILIVSTIIMILVMLYNHAIIDFITVNCILVAVFFIDSYFLLPKGYDNKIFFSLFSVLGCYSWSTFIHFYQTNKEKQKIKGTFSRYLAPSIVNDLLKNPEKVKLGGEKKNITVFFSDVRDFTSISEKLTPEQLSHALNLYMTMMTDTLFAHQGTLDKYIGDAMVAYWGAPVEIPDHPYWAIKGALAMIEKLPAINEEFKKYNYPEFKHGIGLNTGVCSVGNMGSNQIFSYTALGDNMNLGARLESLCKFYGVELNVSEYTMNAIPLEKKSEFRFRTLDKVKVKGKEKSVTIYEVFHSTHPLYNEVIIVNDYEHAFQEYLNQNFPKAQEIFLRLHEKFPKDPTFKRMLFATEEFLKVPPAPGWDGSFAHKSK